MDKFTLSLQPEIFIPLSNILFFASNLKCSAKIYLISIDYLVLYDSLILSTFIHDLELEDKSSFLFHFWYLHVLFLWHKLHSERLSQIQFVIGRNYSKFWECWIGIHTAIYVSVELFIKLTIVLQFFVVVSS